MTDTTTTKTTRPPFGFGRVESLEIKLSPDEKARLRRRARAAGMTMGAFIRHKTLSGPEPTESRD